jgi:hypothetical protein
MSNKLVSGNNHVLQDLTGQRFHRLTVLAFAGFSEKRRRAQWLCRCDCGNEKVIVGADFRKKRGPTTSCGCGINPPMDERLWDKVRKNKENGCWEWQGWVSPQSGYGKIGTNSKGHWDVHRFVYELVNGPIPEGLWVLHRCDNRICCNPVHLYLGTAQQNSLDMVSRGRANGSEKVRKLSLKLAQEIRQRYNAEGITQHELASEYGVVCETIGDIVTGKTWQGPAEKACKHCGTPFVPRNRRSIFCSEECARKYRWQQKLKNR